MAVPPVLGVAQPEPAPARRAARRRRPGPYLLKLCEGRGATEYAFAASKRGKRKVGRPAKPLGNGKPALRDWPRKWGKRVCAAAGVPVVCAHAMRGAHATRAVRPAPPRVSSPPA